MNVGERMSIEQSISLISILLAVVVPILTGIFTYRQVMAGIARDKENQREEQENKRLSLLVGIPTESATAFDMGSKALRGIIQDLRAELVERDRESGLERQRSIAEITTLRSEMAQRDIAHEIERVRNDKDAQLLHKEIRDLHIKMDEQTRGIEALTAQVRKFNEEPVYQRKKTGPLPDQ